MSFASPILQLVKGLWDLASKPLGYIYNLKDNADSLQNATKELKAVNDDVKARVEREEKEKVAQCTKQVENWLGDVQNLVDGEDRVRQEVGERDRIKCPSRCLPQNYWSSYKLGKRVDQMLNKARELKRKREEFSYVTLPLGPPRGLKIPTDETIGLNISLNEVLKWLVDKKQARKIGLYGIGGVGKTTLMKMINNELSHPKHGFDIVIWVEASSQVKEDSPQEIIRKRLHIQDESWRQLSHNERIHYLCKVLTPMKFVLLIDDVWVRLDLSNIGVPGLKNGSKIVFTTRLKHICNQMGAEKTLEVRCLTLEVALELFEKNIGKSLVDYHREIQGLAKDIVEECKGLPLALITVGQVMAMKYKASEWRHMLTILRNKPYKLSVMVDKVYRILESSYNSLNDSAQRCFLYCCLFPEGYHIIEDELIEHWIGEDLLRDTDDVGDTDDVYRKRDKGESALEDLKRACLLESGCHDNGEQYVKMHDVIRDMATWIAREHGQRENKLIVIEKDKNMFAEIVSKWGEAEKVSLWGDWIPNIEPPNQLKTLFVRKTNVKDMPIGFFNSMTACLMVLDLTGNGNIKSFPEGICNLINLRYLNLSATCISIFPEEIKNLTHLQWLLLDDLLEHILIPTGAITSLPLNVFSQWSNDINASRSGQVNEEEMIEELQRTEHLIDLSIIVFESSSALKIFHSPNLQRRVRRARMTFNQKNLTSIVIGYLPANSGGFSHLEVIHLFNCPALEKMEITQEIGQAPNYNCFPCLVEVGVYRCKLLLDLSWLVHAPKLRKLEVQECDKMEKIIGDGLAASELFSNLEFLDIKYLPKLTSICNQTLVFPQGASFRIFRCPGLKKLPLDPNSMRRSFSVYGDAYWWALFEWDDPNTEVTFQGVGDTKKMAFKDAIHEVEENAIRNTTMEFRPSWGE